jgi:epoxyqueuosine reductase
MGWIGKHTNTVSKEHGSWWLLGAIITNDVLEENSPMEDHCGTCTSCLEACPTGAISTAEPGKMDARRCISYLTIELRGAIPRDLRPLIGQWVFGCDLCLDVCPWNRFAGPSVEPRLEPREELINPVLEEMLSWTQEHFSRVMKGSPIKRTKRRGLLRNVAVALGNSGDLRVLPALIQCLAEEPEPLVRGHAAWAISRLGGELARPALEAAKSDTDEFVREEVLLALADLS